MSPSRPVFLQAATTVLRLSLGAMWISHALLKLVVSSGCRPVLRKSWPAGRAQNAGWRLGNPVFLFIASAVAWLLGDGAFAPRRSARFAPAA